MVMPTREELQAQINQRLGLPSDYAGATAAPAGGTIPQAQGPVAPAQNAEQTALQQLMQQHADALTAARSNGILGSSLGPAPTRPIDPNDPGRLSEAQSLANQTALLGQHQQALDNAEQNQAAHGYQAYVNGTAQVDVNGQPMTNGQLQKQIEQQQAQRSQAIQQQYRQQQAQRNRQMAGSMPTQPSPQGPVRPQGQPQQRPQPQQNSFMQYASMAPKAIGALGGLGSLLGGLF